MHAAEIALLLHLLSAFLFLSGIVVAGVAFEAARRREQPGEIALLLGLSRYGVVFVAVGAIGLPVFGAWLVSEGGFAWGEAWLAAALGLYVLALALGAVGGRRPRHARTLAEGLAAAGEPASGELRALLEDPRSRLANYASLATVIAIVALMVFK